MFYLFIYFFYKWVWGGVDDFVNLLKTELLIFTPNRKNLPLQVRFSGSKTLKYRGKSWKRIALTTCPSSYTLSIFPLLVPTDILYFSKCFIFKFYLGECKKASRAREECIHNFGFQLFQFIHLTEIWERFHHPHLQKERWGCFQTRSAESNSSLGITYTHGGLLTSMRIMVCDNLLFFSFSFSFSATKRCLIHAFCFCYYSATYID